MTHYCPKCNRYGMVWDGRAKLLMCYYNNCNHVNQIPKEIYEKHSPKIPTNEEIERAIKHDSCSPL